MSKKMTVTYYHHSGFAVASGDTLLVFDYWTGKARKMPPEKGITPEILQQFSQVYVFITHGHEDHLDDVVFTWQQYAPVTYILADELPEEYQGRRMKKGGELTLNDRLTVKAFGSTDAGVSYYVTLDGMHFFHAGDLNFWHWRDVCTAAQIKEAEDDFKREVADLGQIDIDVAFFPVDPRLGMLFDAGANYFMVEMKPRLLLPMHFWNRGDVMIEFARRSRSRDTEIVALTQHGQSITLDVEDDGFMNITLNPVGGVRPVTGSHPVTGENPVMDAPIHNVSLDGYEGIDPFHETDLPVDMGR